MKSNNTEIVNNQTRNNIFLSIARNQNYRITAGATTGAIMGLLVSGGVNGKLQKGLLLTGLTLVGVFLMK